MKNCLWWIGIVLLPVVSVAALPTEKVPGEVELEAPDVVANRLVAELGSTDPAVSDAAWGTILAASATIRDGLVTLEGSKKLTEQTKAKLDHVLALKAPLVKAKQILARRAETVQESAERQFMKAYDLGTYHDSRWDDDARAGIEYYTLSLCAERSVEGRNEMLRASYYLERAISAGCADPAVLIKSIFSRENSGTITPEICRERLLRAYHSDDRSPTNPYVKGILDGRMVRNAQIDPAFQIDAATGLNDMVEQLKKAVTDKDFSPMLARDAADNIDQTASAAGQDGKIWFDKFYPAIEAAYPHSGPILLEKGRFYMNYAWAARGGDYAANTTDAQFKSFGERLAIARDAFDESWDVDPHEVMTCEFMLRVELGLDDGKDKMEKWFRRGVEVNPADIKLYNQKRLYFEPEWHGSQEELIKFGKECEATELYAQFIPVTLAFAHRAVAKYTDNPVAYLQRPAVWGDISRVYEQSLRYYPEALDNRIDYIQTAVEAEKWTTVIEQVDLINKAPEKVKPEVMAQLNALRHTAEHELKK